MNNDTISLLQECSAGANMAMSAIDQVLEGVGNPAAARRPDREPPRPRPHRRRDAQSAPRAGPGGQGGQSRRAVDGMAENELEADRPPRRRDRCRPDRRRLQYGRQIPDALSESVSRRQRPRRALAGQLIDAEEQLSNELRRYL